MVTWSNFNELGDKIKFMLSNDSYRNRIGRNGYNRTIKEHQWTHRFERVRQYVMEGVLSA